MPEITLRLARDADLDWLDDMHTMCMKPHVEKLYTWKPTLFRERFKPAEIQIIERGGEPIGMLRIEEDADGIRLGDIFLHPRHQNQGIGSSLVDRLIKRSRSIGLPICLQVLKSNPARWLYERKGFEWDGETAYHVLMKRKV